MFRPLIRLFAFSVPIAFLLAAFACGGAEETATPAPGEAPGAAAAPGAPAAPAAGGSGNQPVQQAPALGGAALQQHSIFTTPAIGSLLARELPPGRMTNLSVPIPVTKNYPPMEIDPTKSYKMVIEMEKGKGTVEIQLHAQEAPLSVNSLVHLARQGYFDGLIFHRVIHATAAETGDPKNRGCCGPGYEFDNEPNPNLRFDGPGVVGMMNRGYSEGFGTNGSQFFIAYAALPFLDSHEADGTPKDCRDPLVTCNTVVGKVLSGMEVLSALIPRDPVSADQVPGEKMEKVTIVEE